MCIFIGYRFYVNGIRMGFFWIREFQELTIKKYIRSRSHNNRSMRG
jgi:hypothetical protein